MELEVSKIEFLKRNIEEMIKSLAFERGFVSLTRDGSKLRSSLVTAAGGFILGILITKDKFAALNAGISSFDGMLQGFGESKWVVSLGEKISVMPLNDVSQVRNLGYLGKLV